MGWETQRTTALPELPAHGNGRHRRRRRLGGLATAGVLLTIGVTGAMLSPVLIGWTGPLVPPAARASAVVPPTAPAQSDPMANVPMTTAPPPTTTPPLTASALPTANSKPAYEYAGFEDKVLALTNEQRGKQGCQALRRDPKLVKAARAHSRDMAAHKYFDHTGLDKSSPGARMDRAGYDADAGWAENIAYGFPTPEAVMDKWMNSPGHRQNILDCGLKALGVGVARAADNSLYWTQDFGRV